MTEDRIATLLNRTILVVEDDYFLAKALAMAFAGAGAKVLGPVSNVDDALDMVRSENALDGAVLDVNLQGQMVYPVADALSTQGVPFVFTTGYDDTSIPPAYREVACCRKPVKPEAVMRELCS